MTPSKPFKTITLLFNCICLVWMCTACQAPQETWSTSTGNDSAQTPDDFVHVQQGKFFIGQKPYRIIGTNMWYGAYLGALDEHGGNRKRLEAELDLLADIGVNNIRILGASELSPLQNSISPAILNADGEINTDLLDGLDFLLSEMKKRDMRAVIYLNNFWEWSGGMATYHAWTDPAPIVDPLDPNTPWPAFALYSANYYQNPKAINKNYAYVQQLLQRRNRFTGIEYKNDPTIMSWQLANEPRPGNGEQSLESLPYFYKWVKATATLIKSYAPNQLVSIGSEGTMGCLRNSDCVIESHSQTNIDYMTFHMWLKNWSWFDVNQPENTFESAIEKAQAYIKQHKEFARQLDMPLVLEEFGLERDMGLFSPTSSTQYRDQYYQYVFEQVESSLKKDGIFQGTNFWAWGGFGRAHRANALWENGDTQFVGDPPQEPQGLNSVFDSDLSTLDVIKNHAERVKSL